MGELVIGVGQVTLYIRHARTLKDKRQIVKSFQTRLRNQGFSVTEYSDSENAKVGSLGFTYAGSDVTTVENLMDDALRSFIGDFEVASREREVFAYSEMEDREDKISDLENDEFSK